MTLSLDFKVFPQLVTERLLLRQVEMRDSREMFGLRSDAEHMQYIAKPVMKNEKEAEQYIQSLKDGYEKRESVTWAIAMKENDVLIGAVGYHNINKEHFRSEMGYILHKNYHRRGLMHEALRPVIDFGFQTINLHRIDAVIDKENIASEKLLLKNKFVKEGHFAENYFFEGKFLDSVYYGRLNPAH